MTSKKVTRATLKAFINKNKDLYLRLAQSHYECDEHDFEKSDIKIDGTRIIINGREAFQYGRISIYEYSDGSYVGYKCYWINEILVIARKVVTE